MPRFLSNLLPVFKWLLFYTVCFGRESVFLTVRNHGIRLAVTLTLYERKHMAFLRTVVRRGSTAIDVGANCGAYSILLSDRVGPEGTVWAFEPIAGTYSCLQRNMAHKKNVRCLQLALSDRTRSEVDIHIPRVFGAIPEPALASLQKPLVHAYSPVGRWMQGFFKADDQTQQKVSTQALDSFCGQMNDVSFIKVDIEGHEVHFFNGAKTVLKKFRPIVQFESHDRDLGPFESIAQELNFSLRFLSDNGRLIAVTPDVLTDPNNVVFYMVPQ